MGILWCPRVTQVWGQLPPLQDVGLFIPVSLYSDTPLFGYYSGIWEVELFAPSHHPRPLLLAELQPILQLVCAGRSRSELCGGTAQIFGSCGLAKSWRSSVHHQRLLGTLWGISEWRLKNLSSSYILNLNLLCAPQRRPFRGSEHRAGLRRFRELGNVRIHWRKAWSWLGSVCEETKLELLAMGRS